MDQLLIKVNTINSIRANQKINTHTLQIYNDSMRTNFVRTIGNVINTPGNSRWDLYNFLSIMVDEALSFIGTNSEDDRKYRELLYQKVSMLPATVENIKITYQNDKKFIASIDALISRLNISLANLQI